MSAFSASIEGVDCPLLAGRRRKSTVHCPTCRIAKWPATFDPTRTYTNGGFANWNVCTTTSQSNPARADRQPQYRGRKLTKRKLSHNTEHRYSAEANLGWVAMITSPRYVAWPFALILVTLWMQIFGIRAAKAGDAVLTSCVKIDNKTTPDATIVTNTCNEAIFVKWRDDAFCKRWNCADWLGPSQSSVETKMKGRVLYGACTYLDDLRVITNTQFECVGTNKSKAKAYRSTYGQQLHKQIASDDSASMPPRTPSQSSVASRITDDAACTEAARLVAVQNCGVNNDGTDAGEVYETDCDSTALANPNLRGSLQACPEVFEKLKRDCHTHLSKVGSYASQVPAGMCQ
jgi:hypothetical protein